MAASDSAAAVRAMAASFNAGARRLEGWVYNVQDQHMAEALRAMATEANAQADLLEETPV